ncbi:regulator [Nocardioides humilatus]|uniref:Regulator n=2 Tax=Nocardioides humilatus TaxID=2607660 RepID=A0A5B1L786_9ACTN|nr:regulator [Nocardioides humilatus]
MEAWADTMVPGERRYAGDKVVLGATPGPGAVQAGAWKLYNDPDVGLGPLLPALAALIDTEAITYAAGHGKVVLGFVELTFKERTAVAQKLLGGPPGPVQLVWYALAAMPILAFHTAGHLDTATAVRDGHPGLTWLGFPQPDDDGIWRFPDFSYRRALARTHPRTTATGHPA